MWVAEERRVAWAALRRRLAFALGCVAFVTPIVLLIDAGFGWQLNAAAVAVALAGGAVLVPLLIDVVRRGSAANSDATDYESAEIGVSPAGSDEASRRNLQLIEEALMRDEVWRALLAPELRGLALALNATAIDAHPAAADDGGTNEARLVNQLLAGRLDRPDARTLRQLLHGIANPGGRHA